MNKRRKLVFVLGASVITAPFGSLAQQQTKIWRVGFLSQRNRPDSLDSDQYGAFPRGMRELGYVEGKNLMIEWRFADNDIGRLSALAEEFVRLKVDVIVAIGSAATSAAQKATVTIPIIMGSTGDPVGSGFVKNLARPGGNITGITNLITEVAPKYLEMLRSMLPRLSRVAVLLNPANSAHGAILKSVQSAAQRAGMTILPEEARAPEEIDSAFSRMARQNAGAVYVVQDSLFTQQRRQIVELEAKHRLPSITAPREHPEAGGLMSYGPNYADNYRRAATYVDKIFKGAKPADLPVEQPTKFELIINGKTAKALGLTIPQSLLISADKVIE